MKLGGVTKLDKRNKKASKKVDDDVISENCDVFHFTVSFEKSGSRIPDA